MRGRSRFKPHRYRAERMRALVRHVEHADAERRRLEALLGLALKVAVRGQQCSEFVLLEVLADVLGTELSRSAHLEERWKERKRNTPAWVESTETDDLTDALEAVA